MNVNFWESFFGVNINDDSRFIDNIKRIFPVQNQIWGVKEAVWIDTNDDKEKQEPSGQEVKAHKQVAYVALHKYRK